VTAKEQLHQLVDTLSDQEAEVALRLLGEPFQAHVPVGVGDTADRDDGSEMAAMPEGWGTTLTGEPMPDVVAAVRRSRAAH
jgi:hypothetical protein